MSQTGKPLERMASTKVTLEGLWSQPMMVRSRTATYFFGNPRSQSVRLTTRRVQDPVREMTTTHMNTMSHRCIWEVETWGLVVNQGQECHGGCT